MDVEAAIAALEQLIVEARPVPLSASVMVNKAEVDEAVAGLRAALPEEIRQARWVLKERDELLDQAAREAELMMADARAERDRIVSETEVVGEARREADRIVAEAHQDAEQLRIAADDYIDSKLASFEIVLQKTMRAVEKGRQSLSGRLASDELSGELPVEPEGLVRDAEALEDLRPSQFYDHETGR